MAGSAKLETRTAHLWLGTDDVLHGVFKEDAVEDVQSAQENIDAAFELVGDRKVPVLIDMSNMKAISRDARNLYAGEQPAAYSIAQALITRSQVSKLIGNFFLGLNKPIHPVRLFTSEEAALAWLEEKRREAS